MSQSFWLGRCPLRGDGWHGGRLLWSRRNDGTRLWDDGFSGLRDGGRARRRIPQRLPRPDIWSDSHQHIHVEQQASGAHYVGPSDRDVLDAEHSVAPWEAWA